MLKKQVVRDSVVHLPKKRQTVLVQDGGAYGKPIHISVVAKRIYAASCTSLIHGAVPDRFKYPVPYLPLPSRPSTPHRCSVDHQPTPTFSSSPNPPYSPPRLPKTCITMAKSIDGVFRLQAADRHRDDYCWIGGGIGGGWALGYGRGYLAWVNDSCDLDSETGVGIGDTRRVCL